jgi:hypothetical protein
LSLAFQGAFPKKRHCGFVAFVACRCEIDVIDDLKKRSWIWNAVVVSLVIIAVVALIAWKLSDLTGLYTDIGFWLLMASLIVGWVLKYLFPIKPKQE